jgi:glycosyltransferase involved in cell wall biosynthesis
MIPVYEPPVGYLEEALRSVLQQDSGPQETEIVVLDDCSPTVATEELVKRLGGSRVQFLRNPSNLGLAGTWNACIKQARGMVVHLLHQDDTVEPGFYNALRRGFESSPDVGAAFCRHSFMDEHSRSNGLSRLERDVPGLLKGFDHELAYQQLIHCPAIAVRRSVYNEVGLFRSDLEFVLDWDMWLRIAAKYPLWFEPSVLAHYRIHGAAATSRLALEARDIAEVRRFLGEMGQRVPGLDPSRHAVSKAYHAAMAIARAEMLLAHRQFLACFRQVLSAFRLSLSPLVFRQLGKFAARVAVSASRRFSRKNTEMLLWK